MLLMVTTAALIGFLTRHTADPEALTKFDPETFAASFTWPVTNWAGKNE